MKFKGPENVTSISVGGECFNVGDDGLIETPDNGEYASLLAPHGFLPHFEAAAAGKTKAETAAEKKAREKAEKAAAEAEAAAIADAEAAKAKVAE